MVVRKVLKFNGLHLDKRIKVLIGSSSALDDPGGGSHFWGKERPFQEGGR